MSEQEEQLVINLQGKYIHKKFKKGLYLNFVIWYLMWLSFLLKYPGDGPRDEDRISSLRSMLVEVSSMARH